MAGAHATPTTVLIPGLWERRQSHVRSSTLLVASGTSQNGRTGEGDIYDDKRDLYVTLGLRNFHKVKGYEYGRPAGAHELRVSVVDVA